MSPITVFFADGDEFPHATANTAEITISANSFPNVRFISMPLLASFQLPPPLCLPCTGERLGTGPYRSSGRAASPNARHLPVAPSVWPNCGRRSRRLWSFEVGVANDTSLDEGVLCPRDELEQGRRF